MGQWCQETIRSPPYQRCPFHGAPAGDGARLGATDSVGFAKPEAATAAAAAPAAPCEKAGGAGELYGSSARMASAFEKCWFALNSEYSVKITCRVSVSWS